MLGETSETPEVAPFGTSSYAALSENRLQRMMVGSCHAVGDWLAALRFPGYVTSWCCTMSAPQVARALKEYLAPQQKRLQSFSTSQPAVASCKRLA
jgi:hypothetical protein